MAEPLSSLLRPSTPPSLSAFERLAPPPQESVIAAEIAARTSPGDVVIDLHGRGGWVARNGIGALRRVYDLESSPLTRLLAEVVLRPPDLRHYDAAVMTLAAHPRGDTELRQAVSEPFSTRCPTCSRAVIVDEFIWDGSAEVPSRRVFRCPFCREQQRGQEQRSMPLDKEDVARARAIGEAPRARRMLRARFPIPEYDHSLPDELLELYTPRTLVALEAIINRLEVDLRAAPIAAALQLALVHTLLPISKLNSYPGRVAALRVQHGRMRPLGERQWRERNPWLAFEDACRQVRSFLARIESTTGTFQPRHGDDIDSLVDGTANVVLRTGSAEQPDNVPVFWQRPTGRTPEAGPGAVPDPAAHGFPGTTPEARHAAGRSRFDPRSRVRLVLSQPPVRWTTENLSFAYIATALVLGHSAAATLPLSGIFGPPPRSAWGREATTLRRSLIAVRPVLASDANAVLVLDRGGPAGLVAGVLGGVGAGFRLSSAQLNESGDDIEGLLEFSLDQPIDDTDHPQLAGLVHPPPDAPFALSDVEQAVSDVAVAVLQARGEPARAERLLGEVLIGLDRLGHLRRLAATSTFAESEAEAQPLPLAPVIDPTLDEDAGRAGDADAADGRAAADAAVDASAGEVVDGAEDVATRNADADEGEAAADAEAGDDAGAAHDAEAADAAPAGPPSWALSPRSPHDHVRLLMEIVMGELRRPDNSRLIELEPGRWWLRDAKDVAHARQPLSDRLEWVIFGLLSTSSQGMAEQQFLERVARMFRGHDTADQQLVSAILESYRDRSAPSGVLRTTDDLAGRHAEHGAIVGMLVEYGHRLGLRCWASEHEQRRSYREGKVADLLSEEEQRAYLPLIVAGDVRTLETLDCMWYLRGKANFIFEVEWTAMLAEPLLTRGPTVPTDERLVRFLVIPDERAELVRLKLSRSPLLRRAMEEGNWHVLKWSNVRRLHAAEEASLEALGPMLGLDPEIEEQAEQLPLFETGSAQPEEAP